MNAAKTFFVVAFVVALLVLSLYVVAASTKPLIPNRYGNLLITSDPSGPSGVYLCAYKQFQNGISIGYEFLSTPVYLRSLGELGIPNGTYSLYIQKPGFKIYEQQVSISGNKITKVHAKLGIRGRRNSR